MTYTRLSPKIMRWGKEIFEEWMRATNNETEFQISYVKVDDDLIALIKYEDATHELNLTTTCRKCLPVTGYKEFKKNLLRFLQSTSTTEVENTFTKMIQLFEDHDLPEDFWIDLCARTPGYYDYFQGEHEILPPGKKLDQIEYIWGFNSKNVFIPLTKAFITSLPIPVTEEKLWELLNRDLARRKLDPVYLSHFSRGKKIPYPFWFIQSTFCVDLVIHHQLLMQISHIVNPEMHPFLLQTIIPSTILILPLTKDLQEKARDPNGLHALQELCYKEAHAFKQFYDPTNDKPFYLYQKAILITPEKPDLNYPVKLEFIPFLNFKI